MSYTQPEGMFPDDSKKEEKTTTDPGQLGYHTTNKGITNLTNAINGSEPNKGPMRESTSGTYNFSKGFTLGGDKGGSFADKHISGMKSNVSKAIDSTNRGSKIEKRWKDAGGVELSKQSGEDHSGKYTEYYPNSGPYGSGYTMTKGEVKDWRNKGELAVQGEGAIPKAKDGASIHKGPGGNIIENIEGTPGKTKDKAIIYKAPKKVSIRKGDVTKGGTINTNQQTRGGFKSVKHYTTEEYTPEGVMTGANWQEKSKKYNTAAAQDAMRNKTSKERRQDKRQGRKDAAFNKKEQKGLTKALERQGREEYRSRENKPSGVANYGKTKNARQYGKAYAQQQLKMQKGL